jgi:ParB family chromosome partitioning protein
MVTMNPEPAATYENGQLYQIPITDFRPDPDQPRKVIDPDALAELAASIAQLGVVQPLLFREAGEGWLTIVSGERRYQAAMQVGLLVLPAICVTGNHAEIALVENIQRQDLTVIEEAEAVSRLMTEQQYTQEQLGVILGKSRSSIGDSLSLMRLPEDIRDEARGNRKFLKTRLLEISRKTQQRAMLTAYAKLKDELEREAAAKGQKKERLPAAASLCQTMDRSREKLEKTAPADWSEEERQAASDAVAALRDAADAFLTALAEGGGEAGDETGGGAPSTELS